MSDDYIRLIPTQVSWQPTRAAAVAATSYVASLFSAPNGSADAEGHEFYDQVRFIDSGVNTSEAKSQHAAAASTWTGSSKCWTSERTTLPSSTS
ncbi:hypothetical protein [Cellulosimicrobium sp. KWT-B]|uniref:hypothetical protein n=1 Tax=Cellulosimicrobium sp. KWT-B TaxID=1981152 RepID=UPI0011777A2F|nr:hypothetical protein [Cellulosimicrobium sp. KWT-B]